MTRLEYEIELCRLSAEQPENRKVLELALKLFLENTELRERNAALQDAARRAYKARDEAIALRDEVLDIGTWNAALNAAYKAIEDLKHTRFSLLRIKRLAKNTSDTEPLHH